MVPFLSRAEVAVVVGNVVEPLSVGDGGVVAAVALGASAVQSIDRVGASWLRLLCKWTERRSVECLSVRAIIVGRG